MTDSSPHSLESQSTAWVTACSPTHILYTSTCANNCTAPIPLMATLHISTVYNCMQSVKPQLHQIRTLILQIIIPLHASKCLLQQCFYGGLYGFSCLLWWMPLNCSASYKQMLLILSPCSLKWVGQTPFKEYIMTTYATQAGMCQTSDF